MHLSAVMLPPAEICAELAAVVASVQLAGGDPGRHRGARGALGRLVGKDVGASASVKKAATEQLRPVPPFNMRIELATFGNLDRANAARLLDTLQDDAAQWNAVRLNVAGGTVLDWEGDDSAWASLDGELDGLKLVATGVAKAGQGLQLFVDRRRFRPMIKVGQVNEETTVGYLEQLQTDIAGFTSEAWTQSRIALVQGGVALPGEPDFRPYAEIELVDPAAG